MFALIPIFFLIFIGSFNIGNTPDYFFLRDVWMLLKIIILMLIGVNLSYGLTLQDFEKLAIGIGVSYLVLSLLMSFYYLLNGINLLELRQAVDFHVTSLGAIILILGRFSRTTTTLILLMAFTLFLLDSSNTSLVLVAVLLYFIFMYKKNNTVLFSFFIVSFPAVLFLNIVFPIFDRASLWLNELSPFVWFESANLNVNTNWRGFETYLAIVQYSQLSLIEQIFGDHGIQSICLFK